VTTDGTTDGLSNGTQGLTATLHRPQSLSRRAYQEIRQGIRDGSFERDRRYSENELAVSLGISRTPVREALLELARQGLVEIFPQRGFRLRELSSEECAEIFALRGILEGYIVQILARAATAEQVIRLNELLIEQSKAVDDPGTFLAIDEEFHLLMPDMACQSRTRDMLSTLRGAMWLMGSSALATPRRSPEVLAEHHSIVDAIAAHEPTRAARAIRKHISATAHAVNQSRRGRGV